MITYKDMTFCYDHWACKKRKKCGKALTPEVIEASIGADLPISMTKRFECFVPIDIHLSKKVIRWIERHEKSLDALTSPSKYEQYFYVIPVSEVDALKSAKEDTDEVK